MPFHKPNETLTSATCYDQVPGKYAGATPPQAMVNVSSQFPKDRRKGSDESHRLTVHVNDIRSRRVGETKVGGHDW